MRQTERGVSPVISTILMVAVVVVLAATTSIFVFGVGEAVTDPAPGATFDEKQTENGTVVLTHTAGEAIDRQNLAVRGGKINDTTTPDTITAGSQIAVDPAREKVTLVWETDGNSATLASASGLGTTASDPALVTQTDADALIPVRELGDDPSKDQYDALTSIELTDPFTLAVKAPPLAGEESTDYAVTAFYDEFDAAPSDRLAGPSTPLEFDKNGIAVITIGSEGTDADVRTSIAPGSLSDDASLINNIELPDGSEAVAVERE